MPRECTLPSAYPIPHGHWTAMTEMAIWCFVRKIYWKKPSETTSIFNTRFGGKKGDYCCGIWSMVPYVCGVVLLWAILVGIALLRPLLNIRTSFAHHLYYLGILSRIKCILLPLVYIGRHVAESEPPKLSSSHTNLVSLSWFECSQWVLPHKYTLHYHHQPI